MFSVLSGSAVLFEWRAQQSPCNSAVCREEYDMPSPLARISSSCAKSALAS